MNLLMLAPLLDSRGNLRYFIGAQVDVSGLVKDCTGLDALRHHLDVQEDREPKDEPKDELQELSEMFNNAELETVRRYGGSMHKELEDDRSTVKGGGPRLLIKDIGNYDNMTTPVKPEGRLAGVYKHVRRTRSIYLTSLTACTVPTRSPSPFITHSLRIAVAPCTWNSAVSLPRSHWRFGTCA